jgi:alkanesulfonate monooxygenase SsuD/methylene tetrahydromethanopterin reductase-like flavin-dependent oxidoreductase (luciferase family)
LIREINHKGKHFSVVGPSITEPTPQRIPLIAQAGSSPKGVDFGAENAELIYTLGFDKDATRKVVDDIKRIAKERYGRDPNSIKFIAPLTPFLGATREEAQEKFDNSEKYGDPIDHLIYFGGASGIDVSGYDFDEPIVTNGKSDGVQSTTQDVLKNSKTPRQIADNWKKGQDFVGTGAEIADKIEDFVEATGVDGINFNFHAYNQGIKDVVEFLIPELQRRGLAQKEYPVQGGTFRENLFGVKGLNFVPESHPAHKLRWAEGQTKEEFEAELEEYTKLRDERRADYYKA